MKPVTYDFDVITDAPAPRRRVPQPAEPAPPADAEGERSRRGETRAHGSPLGIQAVE